MQCSNHASGARVEAGSSESVRAQRRSPPDGALAPCGQRRSRFSQLGRAISNSAAAACAPEPEPAFDVADILGRGERSLQYRAGGPSKASDRGDPATKRVGRGVGWLLASESGRGSTPSPAREASVANGSRVGSEGQVVHVKLLSPLAIVWGAGYPAAHQYTTYGRAAGTIQSSFQINDISAPYRLVIVLLHHNIDGRDTTAAARRPIPWSSTSCAASQRLPNWVT